MKLDDVNVNVGVCPECQSFSSFKETKKINIYQCAICQKKVEQYVNGKIIYKTNKFKFNNILNLNFKIYFI